MKKLLPVLMFSASLCSISSAVLADPPMPPFYTAVMKMAPEGKLGQVIKKERIETSVRGAQAWKIAYISSDVAGRKTISTGTMLAPVGPTPKEGRPILAWVHGTTGSCLLYTSDAADE